MLAPFRKIVSTTPELDLVQDNIKAVLDPLLRIQQLDTVPHLGVVLKAGSNTISHGLGRKYVSYYSGNLSAAAMLSTGTSPDASKFLVIVASAPCTADIFVF